jgi:hypothetical protein
MKLQTAITKDVNIFNLKHKQRVVRLSAKVKQSVCNMTMSKIVLSDTVVSSVWMDNGKLRGTVKLHETAKPSRVWQHASGLWVLVG